MNGEDSLEGSVGRPGSCASDMDCTDASTMTTASSPHSEDEVVHLSDCLATFTAAETLQQDVVSGWGD